MLTIAAFAFKEARRKRLVLAVGLLSLGFLCLFALMARLLGTHSSFAADPLERHALGLGIVLFGVYLARSFAGLLAILVAAGAISTEVESGALQSVLVRPVPRAAVVLGKFIGYGVMLVLYTVALQGAVLLLGLAVLGARLPSPAGVLAYLCLEPLILLALTLFGSTFLPTLANGAAGILLYGLAVVGGDVEQMGVFLGNRALSDIGIASSLLLPADVMYRRAFALASGGLGDAVTGVLGPIFGSLSRPDALMVVYAVVYLGGLLAAAVAVFQRRDI